MNPHMELRVSFHIVASFLLTNLLLTGTTFADRFKTSFMHENRREPATHDLSAWGGGPPTQHMQPSEKQDPTGTWFPETALYRKKCSEWVQLSSSNLQAQNDFTSIPVPDGLSPRRVLRDVSPPGMWPPGTDSPPSSESFMEFARRRLLQLSAAENENRRGSKEELLIELSSPGRSVHCDTSPPGMSARSASSPSEEFGRSRSLPELSAPDFKEDIDSLKKGADALLKSRKSILSDTPGLWPVGDSPPSETASRRPLTVVSCRRKST